MDLMFNDRKVIRNSYLNSLTAFDYIEKKHTCPVQNMLKSLAHKSHTQLDLQSLDGSVTVPEEYIAFQHEVSNEHL